MISIRIHVGVTVGICVHPFVQRKATTLGCP
jgi:hypothetical protein